MKPHDQRRQAAEMLHEWFGGALRAFDGLYDAMTSDDRHRRVAMISTAARVAGVIRGMKDFANPTDEVLGLHLRLLASLCLYDKTAPTASAWREAVDLVFVVESAGAELVALFGEPAAAEAQKCAQDPLPFLSALDAFLNSQVAAMLELPAKEAREMVVRLGLRRLVTMLREAWTPDRLKATGEPARERLLAVNAVLAGLN